jgi:hypothetical protein
LDQPAWKGKPKFKTLLSTLNDIVGKCDDNPKSDNEAKDTAEDDDNDTSDNASAAFRASLGLSKE